MAIDLKTAITISVDAKAVRSNVEVARRALADLKREAGSIGGASTAGLARQFDGAAGSAVRLGGVVRGLAGPLAALASAAGVAALARQVVLTADAFKGVDARLKLATRSTQEYNTASSELFNVSQRTRSDLAETVNLYSRVASSIRELGGSQKDAISVTEIINQSFKMSGASAASSAAGVQQLSQALASGVLRGDEFNSVMENSPRLARALAAGLGVPIGALRAMAEQGELTADKVIQALLSQKDVIDREFRTLPVTIDQASTSIGNSLTRLATIIDQKLGASSTIAGGLQRIADAIDGTVDSTAGAEKRLAALRQQQVDNAQFDGEVRLTEDRIKELSDAELKGYQARIQGAVDFNQAQRDLARQSASAAFGAGNDSAGARLARVAGAANKEVQLYQNTLDRIKDLLGQRTSAEQGAANDRLRVLVKSIEDEQKALKKANDDLEEANKRRKDIAAAFKDTQSKINAGPQTGDKQPNVVTAIDAIARARAQLQGGQGKASDPEAALKSAEEARTALELLASTDSVSKQFLTSLNQQASKVADEAAAKQEGTAQGKIDTLKQQLADLAKEGAAQLKITFDTTQLADQVAAVLEAADKELAKHPLAIPTTIAAPGAAPAANDGGVQVQDINKLLKRAAGGPIVGPGTATSDSILVRMSNNEHVLTAAEVAAAGGHGSVYRLRALLRSGLLRFAGGGGMIDGVRVPSIPSAARAGGRSTSVVNITMDGQTFSGEFSADHAAGIAAAIRERRRIAGARNKARR